MLVALAYQLGKTEVYLTKKKAKKNLKKLESKDGAGDFLKDKDTQEFPVDKMPSEHFNIKDYTPIELI